MGKYYRWGRCYRLYKMYNKGKNRGNESRIYNLGQPGSLGCILIIDFLIIFLAGNILSAQRIPLCTALSLYKLLIMSTGYFLFCCISHSVAFVRHANKVVAMSGQGRLCCSGTKLEGYSLVTFCFAVIALALKFLERPSRNSCCHFLWFPNTVISIKWYRKLDKDGFTGAARTSSIERTFLD